ncbi:hypothetical protein [Sorangium sp. So ce388]|uniref:hypothetical protein n=1 Tax=Sorangium sp. So ce388 TaxID=3133309 RepID=UPI003F5BC038
MSVGKIYMGHPLRLDRFAAVALLRDIGRDQADMAELRRLCAEELDRRAIHGLRDEQVIAQLAERVAAGGLTVALVRRPGPGVPSTMQVAEQGEMAALPPAAQPQAAQEAAAEEATTPMLSNPRWSADRVAVGAEVQALFSYEGFQAGQAVTIKIVECNADGGRSEVESIQVEVEAESGEHRAAWSRSAAEAQVDLEQDTKENDTGPVEYRFTVKADEAESSEESGPLWLTSTVTVKLVSEEDGAPAPDGIEVGLLDAQGEEHRAASKDGKARFEGVLVGPIRVVIGAVDALP